ncbi:MAG: YegS/Rv2252/BmrU family lipid kinase [Anaerolineales bacterium]
MKKTYLAINPSAGHIDHEEVLHYFLSKCSESDWVCDVYETVGDHSDRENVKLASERDYDLYIAAGGDGTVAMVLNEIIGLDTPLAIIPIGTGNGAARMLDIPLQWEQAVDMLFGPNRISSLDTMSVAGKHFLLHIGVGLSGVALRETDLESKRLLGRVYYLVAGLKALFGFQPHRFEITIDGTVQRFKGVEMFVINIPSIGDPLVRWDGTISPMDGRLDVFFVRARTLLDFFHLALNIILGRQRLDPRVTYQQAKQSIYVRSDPALPLQADGEYVTQTPCTVELEPKTIKIVSPIEEGL